MKRTFKIVKGIISYILALALTIVFALFLNASVGWFMLVALILAPILSVFFALLTKANITVECEMEPLKLSKGDKYEMTVKLKNKTIFPSTFIELVIQNGEGVFCEDEGIITTIMPMSSKTIKLEFTGKICGKSNVGIKAVRVSDYLGLFDFKPAKINEQKLTENICVIPEIARISPKEDRILKIKQDSLNSEDAEDTKESVINTFGGFPGYDKREYVPGDPIKRINWKQSAKRGKLLVRLDDEMNSNGINLVLDGYFGRDKLPEGINAPLIAQDAVENALGIIKTLILSDYVVHFYVNFNEGFTQYNIEDEKDVEALRMQMAEYGFSDKLENRLPNADIFDEDSSYVLVTPNKAGQFNINPNVSVFSALDDYEEINQKEGKKSFEELKTEKKKSIKEKICEFAKGQSLPFALASILSIIVFDAFNIKILSGWTILQLVVVLLLFILCNFARKHKFLGFLSVTGVVVVSLMMAGSLITPANSFIQWFLSGGDNYEGGIRYLMVLICFLTLFFALVVYYYSLVQYRTSLLLLISLIAFIVHVKLVRDVKIFQVMLVVVLNVAIFLLNNRQKRDSNKKLIGKAGKILTLALYSVMFILLALAVPKSNNTKYYSEFEDRFLGGNTQVEIPSDYVSSSKYSGNADNIQSLNTRKLYAISGLPKAMNLYLHRSTFDYYDYKDNHWVIYDENYERGWQYEDWVDSYRNIELNQEKLIEAIAKAVEYKPELIEEYGLDTIINSNIKDKKYYAVVTTYNFSSEQYIFPIRGRVFERSDSREQNNIFVTVNGDYSTYDEWLDKDNTYELEFYYDFENYSSWVKKGGANFTLDESLKMLQEINMALYENGEDELSQVVSEYCAATSLALKYKDSYEKENDKIPDSIKELAEEVTKDCTHDWEKAEALMMYFSKGYKYQLGYEAPDDSVEYFLFEGKTGTCSDYASAYVLMARAVGLCARYVEGYATDNAVDTLNGEVELIVRASDSHAYAEIFIPNYGYAIYDPTLGEVMESLVPENEIPANAIVVTYVLTLGARIVIIFAAVSVLLLLIILIIKVITPRVKEKAFVRRVNKECLGKGAVMLYLKLLEKCPLVAENVKSKTPSEFYEEFLKITGYDISPLVLAVLEYKYQEKDQSVLFKEAGAPILIVYKNAIKEYKIALRREKKHNY